MKFEQLNGFVYDSENDVIGAIASVDFIKQTIGILTDDDKIVTAKLGENIEFLEQIGYIGEQGIINHDVVETADGKLYEIELVNKTQVRMVQLNHKLERVATGDIIEKTDLAVLEPYVTFVGNLYELEVEQTVDFNICIVREVVNGETTYYYACNNKADGEVDLIKVIFIGHNILKEEEYKRITMTHEEYLDYVAMGDFEEVTPQQLMSYISRLMSQPTNVKSEEKACCDKNECLCNDNVCQECGEADGKCDCPEW